MSTPTPTTTSAPTTPTPTTSTPITSTPADIQPSTYYPNLGVDSPGNEIGRRPELVPNIRQLGLACDQTPGCVAYNTNGSLKAAVLPKTQWIISSSDLYTKQNPYTFNQNSRSSGFGFLIAFLFVILLIVVIMTLLRQSDMLNKVVGATKRS